MTKTEEYYLDGLIEAIELFIHTKHKSSAEEVKKAKARLCLNLNAVIDERIEAYKKEEDVTPGNPWPLPR